MANQLLTDSMREHFDYHSPIVVYSIIRQPLLRETVKELVNMARLKVADAPCLIIRERGKSLGFGYASGSVCFSVPN
jgi:hypothetical protein